MLYTVAPIILSKLDAIDDLNAMMAEAKGSEEVLDIAEKVEAIKGTIESLEYDIEEIVENISMDIRNCEREAEACAKEMQGFKNRRDSADARAKREKEFLIYLMDLQGKTKLDAGRFKVSIRANGGRLPIEWKATPENLPEEFRKTEIVYKPDDQAVREFLDRGEKSEYFCYKERGRNIQIR